MTLRLPAWERTLVRSDLWLAVIGSGLLAALARVQVPVPWSPVPITGQTFGVLLLAGWWGPRLAVTSVAAYLLEGLLGLPVFASGGGLAAFLGPTGGYLLGFLAMAWVAGWLVQRWSRRGFWAYMLAFALAEVALYALGVVWLAGYVGWSRVWAAGVAPFLPGDTFKAVLAAWLVRELRPRI
ncbi:MAG: biotin transporter BioY [Chloroflexi bacterium]|nr:biotin transporter BioY [Chloroflexota bacterium]